MKFGRLTVLSFVPDETQYGSWLCKCDCGNKKIIRKDSLLNNKRKCQSCGCLKKEELSKRQNKMILFIKLEYGESSFNQLFRIYRHNAKTRNLQFELTRDEFRVLTKQNCFYCGEEPKQISTGRTNFGEYIYNGIDRINSSLGYTKDNAIPCCGTCNVMKMAMGQEEFLNHIKRIYEYQHLGD